MAILILGAQGNLGTQLIKTFSVSNQETIGLDRQDLNFLDFEALADRLLLIKPTVIINAAAYNAVDKCEEEGVEKQLAIKLNHDLPNFLADFCFSQNIFLIHYSTDYVFSGFEKNKLFPEDSPTNPINFYGRSKASGEQEILEAGSRGLKYYLIRTSKLFGPAGNSNFAKPSFFDMILNLAQNGNILRAVDGEYSCFTYTPDLALATKELYLAQAPAGVYHLINEGVATWCDGVLELLRIKKLSNQVIPVANEFFPRPAKRPFVSSLENTKRPKLRSWREALAEYLNSN